MLLRDRHGGLGVGGNRGEGLSGVGEGLGAPCFSEIARVTLTDYHRTSPTLTLGPYPNARALP